MSSKHLSFLSLHIDHHIHDRINLHYLFWFLLPPLLTQQLRRSDVCSGMILLVHVLMRKRFHSWVVNLQYKYRCLFVSHVILYRKHRGTSCLPFLCNTSWVSHTLLVTNQEPLILPPNHLVIFWNRCPIPVLSSNQKKLPHDSHKLGASLGKTSLRGLRSIHPSFKNCLSTISHLETHICFQYWP